jgi:integrase
MESKPKFIPDSKLPLMDQVRQVLRYHHYAYRTERTYCDWIIRFIKFFGTQTHPKQIGKKEIEAFLSEPAIRRKVSASTQRQALNAIVFLYNRVLNISIDGQIGHVRSTQKRRSPVVMTQKETARLLANMHKTHLLMARLLYGSGLRLMESIRLRVQDLDFEQNLIYVRAAKGGKDRVTLFPKTIHADMRAQLEKVKRLHILKLEQNFHGHLFLIAIDSEVVFGIGNIRAKGFQFKGKMISPFIGCF